MARTKGLKKMKAFQTIRKLNEASTNETVVKKFKVGKKKYDASVVKKGSKFVAVLDGDQLDTFSNAKDAEKAINDFIKLMEK